MRTPFASALALAASCLSTAVTSQATCPQPNGKNLLQNAGFEASPASIAPWKSVADPGSPRAKAGVVKPGYRSPQAYGYTSTSGTGAALSQGFSACLHTWYTVSWTRKFTVFSDQPFDPSRVGGYLLGSATNVDDFVSQESNATWVTRKSNFYIDPTVNSSMTYSTSLHDSGDGPPGGGSFAVDNFKLVPIGTLKPKKGARNLVRNGDFETGTRGAWRDYVLEKTPNKHCTVTGPGYGGSKYAYHCKGFRFPAGSALNQNFTTVPLKQYVLSYEYMSSPEGVTRLNFGDTDFEFNLGGLRTTYVGPSENPPSEGQWVHHDVPFVANSDNTLVTFVYICYLQGGQRCSNAFDNISVKEAA